MYTIVHGSVLQSSELAEKQGGQQKPWDETGLQDLTDDVGQQVWCRYHEEKGGTTAHKEHTTGQVDPLHLPAESS